MVWSLFAENKGFGQLGRSPVALGLSGHLNPDQIFERMRDRFVNPSLKQTTGCFYGNFKETREKVYFTAKVFQRENNSQFT